MKTKLLPILIAFVFFNSTSYAQTNGCGSPTVLPVNTTCTTQAFAVNENGTTSQEIDASCATSGTGYSDGWYTVTGTGNTMTITVSGTNRAFALAAFTSCAAGELDCDIQASGVTGSISFPTTNGTTYYIQIQRRSGSNNNNMSGNICAVSAAGGGGGGGLSIDNGDQTLCTGTFTDAGGSGDYSNNENYTATYCSDAGNDIIFNFTSFDSESVDNLLIYNGTDNTAPLLLNVSGHSVTTPFIVSSSNASNCLTFVWDSDGSITYEGWEASISCGIIVPTCSDGIMNQDETGIDCGGATCPACPLSINNGDQTLCTGTFTDAGLGGDYSNNENYTATYCSDAGNDIIFNFTSFDSESIDHLLIYNGTDNTAPLLLDVSGHSVTTPFVVNSSNASNCLTFVWDSDGSITYEGWEAAISCGVIVPTCSDGIMNQDETGIDCGGATCPACPTATAQDCAGGTSICDDATFGGNSSGTGIITDLDASNDGCLGVEKQTSWYTFESDNAGTLEFLIDPDNGTDDYDFAMWGPYPSGSTTASICPPVGAPVRCSFAAGAPTAYGGTGLQIGAGDVTEGTGGDDIVDEIYLNVGDVYILCINNYSTSSSPFTMDITATSGLTLNCTPLPIELLEFNGYAEEGYNQLNWITASEINNDFFEIEKSHDGVLFSEIGSEKGNGNSNNQLSYNFTDNNPSFGISYYRLKQVDFDGKYTYSNVVSVKQSPGAEIAIFPNPTHGKINLNIVSKDAGNYTIIVSDIFKPIHRESIYVERGNHLIRFSYFENIPYGFYMIKVIDENGEIITQQKIIKN